MKLVLKLVLYVALLLAAAWCFRSFRKAYEHGRLRGPAELTAPATEAPLENETATNEVNGLINTASALTNVSSTNVLSTLAGSATNVSATNGPAKPLSMDKDTSSVVFLGLFILALLVLAGMGSWDFVQYLGNRSERAVLASDFQIPTDPDYEAAEAEWAKGNHLDAINLMRSYLGRNPQEQHVAIRIAEIYEKDLNNYLAAALELEEVLLKKLPREKWGWTAIRIANLYSGKLNQSAKALAWLERIARDYPDTGAAKKARQRLGLPEPEAIKVSVAEQETDSTPSAPPEDEPPSNLPKGFRTKK